jgi:hypothetical protein
MTVRPTDNPLGAAVIDGVDVAAVAAVVQGCAGVSALAGGQYGEVVSYLPGRRVDGIAVRDGRVIVQIRAQWAVPVPSLGALITAVLLPLTGNRPVDVVIADIDDPPGGGLEPPVVPGSLQYGCE